MEETNAIKQLEELEVIESSDLAIGHAFHAFKFQISTPSPELEEESDNKAGSD